MLRRHLVFAFTTHAWEKSGVPGHVYWLYFRKTSTGYSLGTRHSDPSNRPEQYPGGFGEYEHMQDVDALFRGRWVGSALPSKDRKSSRQAHSAHYPLSSSWWEAIVSAWMRKTLVDVRVSQRNPSHTFRVLSCCIPPTDPGLSHDPAFHSVPFFPTPSQLCQPCCVWAHGSVTSTRILICLRDIISDITRPRLIQRGQREYNYTLILKKRVCSFVDFVFLS